MMEFNLDDNRFTRDVARRAAWLAWSVKTR
jgi:hypothetical protein